MGLARTGYADNSWASRWVSSFLTLLTTDQILQLVIKKVCDQFLHDQWKLDSGGSESEMDHILSFQP